MSKPKILVFITSYHPFVGGAEVMVQEIAMRLKDRFDFYIITSRFKRRLPKHEKRPEGKVIRMGFGTRWDKYLLPLYLFRHRGGASIVVGVDISQASVAAAIYKLFHPKTPFIFNIQFGGGEERLARGRFGVIGLVFRFVLSRADYVTAISTYLWSLARQYGYRGRGEVVPNGVDLKKFGAQNLKSKLAGQGAKVVITTSRLVPKNGIDILLRAMAEVVEKIPDVRCLIVGDGPEREALKKQAANLTLRENVKFLGEIPHEKIPEYLHQADVFVRPSRSEGMGNSFVEALAAGLPVIGTPVGGIPDIIKDGETGLFAKTDDPKDLAEKIARLLKDPVLAYSLAVAGRKMVEERFNWDKIADRYADLFNHHTGEAFPAPLRILIATPLYPPEIGGPATYAALLEKELPKHNILTTILPFSSVRGFPKFLRHFLYFVKILKQGTKHDIIFALDPVSVGLPAAIAAKILRKKFIVKIVGDYAWEQGVQRFGVKELLDEFLNKRYGFFVELLKKVERWVSRKADKVIVPSYYLAGVLAHWGVRENRISVIYNALDVPRSAVSDRAEARRALGLSGTIIVSAGRLVPWKGFSVLIQIIAEVRKRIPDVSLLIIGSGPLRSELEEQVKKLGLQGRVRFLGAIARGKLLQYLRAADMFVLNTGYEGLPHAVLEAMAMGTPVVTTRVGGNAEVVENGVNGILADYNRQEDFFRAILRLASDKKFAKELTRQAEIRLNRFSSDTIVKATAELLQKTVWGELDAAQMRFGAERYEISEARALRVLMISMDPKILDPQSEAAKRMAFYSKVLDQLSVVILATYERGSLVKIFNFFKAWQRARKLIKKNNFNLISAQDPFAAGLIGYFLKLEFRKPLQLQIHTGLFTPYFWRESFKNKIFVILGKFLLRRADCVRVVSESLRHYLSENIKLNNSKISVLPVYVDFERLSGEKITTDLKKKYPQFDFIILMASRLVSQKNISLAIFALKDLLPKYPRMGLVIVGSGPEREALGRLAADLKLEDNVLFEPWCDNLASYYKTADIFLLTSNYEGWARTVAEAMACGLPVVMTKVGLAGEILKDGENGRVVPVMNKKALVEAVEELYKSPEIRRRFSEAGKKTIENLAANDREKYLELLRDSFNLCLKE